MIVSDLDYLDVVTDTVCLHLTGSSSALAISSFWADTFGPSTHTATVINNQVIVRPNSSFASSSVRAMALSFEGSAFASASSTAAASS